MIKINFSELWVTTCSCAYVGTIFDVNLKTSPQAVFADYRYSKDRLSLKLNRLNGFWGAVVTDGRSEGWIASDRIRSYPVFYAQNNGDLYISNDAYWIREQCHLTEMDKDAEQEFLMTGYVTGSDTLYCKLKQIQSGEIIFFQWSEEESKWVIKAERYYRYLHKEATENNQNKLLEMLDVAIVNSFKRLIDFANGRILVIPLSGGYDSRLVSLILNRLGYEKLIAYTYGVKGNEEASISKKVAEHFNIPWHFIEYTPEKWHEVYHSEEYRRYERYAGGLATLAHAQDFIAVKELKEKNIIPNSSVFIPGLVTNVGGFTTACPNAYILDMCLDNGIKEASLFHYVNGSEVMLDHVKEKNFKRIKSRMGDFAQYVSSASLFECFNYEERQTKYINNSIRVYEFWNYEHYTPFWDKDFLDFWSIVPFEQIMSKKLYKRYLFQECKRVSLFPGEELCREKPISKIRKALGLIFRKFLRNSILISIPILRRKMMKVAHANHPMAWYGCWTENEIDKFIKKGYYNLIGMLSCEYIERLKKLN